MKIPCVALGCAMTLAPATAFVAPGTCSTGLAQHTAAHRGKIISVPLQQQRKSLGRRNRATAGVSMMAFDVGSVHALGDYVNVASSAGIDQAWLSHVVQGGGCGKGGGGGQGEGSCCFCWAFTRVV